MSDRYGELVQSGLGRTVAKNLGLPTPIKLDRHQPNQPILRGEVAFGGAKADKVGQTVLAYLSSLDAKITHQDDLATRLSDDNARFKVVIFNATDLASTDDLRQLYDFFHPLAKRIKPSGRVIFIARPKMQMGTDIGFAMAQQAVLGFAKSFAKEVKQGISVNVLYVEHGAEVHLDHAIGFFASAKSAYVSGQAVYLQQGGELDLAEFCNNQPLLGKKILVTGASRGIGQSVASVLAQDGAMVYCLDVPSSLDQLQQVANEIGGQAVPLDITSADAPAQILATCGVLDGVVHNAGITQDKTLAKMSQEQWERVLNVNLAGIIAINEHLLSHHGLSDSARVVCVSSISAIAGNLGQTNYATSKAGVIGLVQATANCFAGTNRRINAVAPGFIETKMTNQIPFAIREAGRRMNAMSQGGLPVDVAHTISWLLSPKAGGLNGNIIRVCGQSLLGA